MKRIFVVDDEEDVGFLIKKTLEKTGEYLVDYIAQPDQVLPRCQENPPDLILLDIVMPQISGYQLIQALQNDPRTRQILIMVTSGLGEMVYVKRHDKWRWLPNRPVVHQRGEIIKEKNPERAAEAYGVDAYLAKPFGPVVLVGAVNDVFAAVERKPPPSVE